MNSLTHVNLKQPEPVLVYKQNAPTTTLSFNVETDLQNYSKIFITRQFDPFRIVHCFEANNREYLVYGETSEGYKKLLFHSIKHFECDICCCDECEKCEKCKIPCFCCVYVCNDSIEFQMDYKSNGEPFYTQGFNISKGCHCCDNFFCCPNCSCFNCAKNTLYLRENIDPDNPNRKVGRKKGKTETNCCLSCSDRFAEYTTENNLRGQTVRAACCDICLNACLTSCCCNYCVQGCDFEMSIENENGLKTGNVFIFSGCCSEKVKGKFCYIPRPYFEVNMPQGATSEQKFQIIADIIHLDVLNNMI